MSDIVILGIVFGSSCLATGVYCWMVYFVFFKERQMMIADTSTKMNITLILLFLLGLVALTMVWISAVDAVKVGELSINIA